MSAETRIAVVPDGDVFPYFAALPAEIRDLIWHSAIDIAQSNRTLHLEIYELGYWTSHSCDIENGRFCGQHWKCGESNFENRPPSQTTCLEDAYFSASEKFPGVEDKDSCDALLSLRLVCHESEDIFLKRYYRKLLVYQERYHSGVRSRLVRFCPHNDVPILSWIGSLWSDHPVSNAPEDHFLRGIDLLSYFPQNLTRFQEFRRVISSFSSIGFNYSGSRGDRQEDQERAEQEIKIFKNFLGFCDALENLYIWLDLEWWPEASHGKVRVDNVKSLQTGHEDVQALILDAQKFIADFNAESDYHSKTISHSDEHWLPSSNHLTQIGCYAPASWL